MVATRFRILRPPVAPIRGWPARPDLLLGAPVPEAERRAAGTDDPEALLDENGFDPELHEQIRADLRAGRIGLAQNRFPASTAVEDVEEGDVVDRRPMRSMATDRRHGQRRWPTARWLCWPWRPAPAAAGRKAPAWSRPCIRSAVFTAAIATSSRSTWLRPGGRPPMRRRRSLCRGHELSDARADRPVS